MVWTRGIRTTKCVLRGGMRCATSLCDTPPVGCHKGNAPLGVVLVKKVQKYYMGVGFLCTNLYLGVVFLVPDVNDSSLLRIHTDIYALSLLTISCRDRISWSYRLLHINVDTIIHT